MPVTIPDYKVPRTLRDVMTTKEQQGQLPGSVAEDLIFQTTQSKAAEAEAAGAAEDVVARRERRMETEAELFEEGQTTEKQLAEETLAARKEMTLAGLAAGRRKLDRELAFENKALAEAARQSQRATIFAGVKGALNLAGAWWQGKQVDKVVDRYTATKNSIQELQDWVKDFTKDFQANVAGQVKTQKEAFKR